jgi:hypothetical protein
MVTLSDSAFSPLLPRDVVRHGVAASMDPIELGFASALSTLSRFKELMAAEGHDIDLARMRRDSAYAFAQLALGHTSTSEALRHSAMRVFALFHE